MSQFMPHFLHLLFRSSVLISLYIPVAFIDRLQVCVVAIIVVILIATHINSTIYFDFPVFAALDNLYIAASFFYYRKIIPYIRCAEFANYISFTKYMQLDQGEQSIAIPNKRKTVTTAE